ncbi:NAD(P)H-hydrate dehydratase [Mucilaginibacter arboris]|uniref:Bifunctional NAD(P)H-hydrate repair enzyme n=1 Tax=Mucilaginibacter arboris TaxID=2682090 RepID=A0A7K1SVZ0_9SPHI|nr:NAD(P)H-hydrate dehydratase [Mucilaginibacter arboris]MVN21509.1 NAD(P)H-hydrate dehydratase [Mucilaginibacter arboris]
MLKLITSAQMHEVDAHTISTEPIASVDLMERASKAFVCFFCNHFPDKNISIAVYCGTGNNGGDGLAIARLLKANQYENIDVKIARFSDHATADFDTNFTRLKEASVPFIELKAGDFPEENADVIIDALLGSGLNKPLSGAYADLVKHLNNIEKKVIAVDVPTGLLTEGVIDKDAIVLKADLVITFQRPKLNFLLPESASFMDDFVVVDIGLDENFIQNLDSNFELIEEKDVVKTVRPRKKFEHKGTFGHALLIAGQAKTMGAALLCSSAAAYAGVGLTTVCIPAPGLTALNSLIPEVMAIVREEKQMPEIEWDKFTVIGAGPGLGKDSTALMEALFANFKKSVVLDADALNMLSENSDWWQSIPENSIITPHVKEFDRLFGAHTSWWERLETAKKQAAEKKIIIVLKNQYTIITTPEGSQYFNPTGNSAMASGGMGDVLTGIITSFIAQKYAPAEAALLGVYLHGKAGDELALNNRSSVVLAAQVAAQVPVTLAKIIAQKNG